MRILLANSLLVIDPAGANLNLAPHYQSFTASTGREVLEATAFADLMRKGELGLWDFRDFSMQGQKDADPALFLSQLRTWQGSRDEVYLHFRANASNPAGPTNEQYRFLVKVADPGGLGGDVGSLEGLQTRCVCNGIDYSTDTTNNVDGTWTPWAS